MNVFVVAADSSTGVELCRAVCEAGFQGSLGKCGDAVPAETDVLAIDGFAPEQLDTLLGGLLTSEHRTYVLSGVRAETDALDAALAAGVDEFYQAGNPRSLTFRIRLHERRRRQDQHGSADSDRIEQANDVIYTVDFQGRFTSANAAAERLTGYSRSRIIGMNMAELLLPEYLEKTRAEIAAKLAGESAASFFEVQIRHADGLPRWVEISSQLLYENGKPSAVQGIARDLSERRKIERDVAFRAELLDNLEAAAFATALDGRVLYWNQSAEQLFGYSASEVSDADIVELICPADRREIALAWLAELGTGEKRRDEGPLRRRDGTEFIADISTSPIRNADGGIGGAVVVCFDLTERRQQERHLRQMASIVETAAVGAIGRGMDGIIHSWNVAAERLLGYTAEEAIGQRLIESAPTESREEALEQFRRVSAGETLDIETTRIRKDGRVIPVRMTSLPMLDGDGAVIGVLNLLYDLTEKRAGEIALRASEERFRAAAQLSLDAFFILEAVRDETATIIDFRFTDMNSAGERLLAISRTEAIGALLCELLPLNRTGGFLEKYRRVVESGETLDEEFQLRVDAERATWLHHTVVKLGDGIAITSRDISARVGQQQALREARKQLTAIFESTSEAVLVFSRDYRLLAANGPGLEGARTIFGEAPQEGENIRPWVHDSDWEHFQSNCTRAFAGERVTVQWPMATHTGAELWFEYAFNPVRDEQGEVYAVAMAARDISESRRMEHALKEREAALTAVFQSMNESLLLMDEDLRFIMGNPLARARTLRFTGRDPVAGGSMEEYVRPEHWRSLRHFHRKALAGERSTFELDLRDDDGVTTWWEYAYHPVRDDDGEVAAVAMVVRDITDRKAAEQALVDATAHHRAVIDNTSDAIFALDVEGTPENPLFRIAMVNRAFEELTGLRGEMVSGRLVRDVLPAASVDPARARYLEAIAAGTTITYEEVVPHGDAPHVQTTMTPVFDASGVCRQIIGNSRNITERLRLAREERASRERAERLALIVESANDAILSLDLDRRIISWSPGAERVYGYSPEEALGRTPDFLYTLEDVRSRTASERLEEVYTGRAFVDSPTKRRHKDGRELDVLISAFPLRNSEGQIVGVGSTATDISEQRRAEAALRDKAADLAAVFASTHDQIVLLDREANIVSANPAATRNWESAGIRTGRFGGSMRDWVPETALADFDSRFERALQGEAVAFERETNFGDDQQWFDVTYNPVRLEDGSVRGVVITSRNTTAKKRSNETLMQAQKLESLGILAGGIAHDFNNLLVGILGNAGLALSELSPASPARPTVEAIETAGQRAAELARQMLAYSGKGRFLIQNVNLNDLVEEMTHLLRASIGKGVSLQLRLGDDLPSVEGDATQLRQVVMNLVVNASDAIGDSQGVISVTTGVIDATRQLLADSYLSPDLPPGRYISVEVSDSGIGMDQATLNRIFDPFFTTKFTGRGLGLAAVLGIMRGHRGSIKVESEPGEGTTFRLLLPAIASAATAVAPTPVVAQWRGSGLVLVVDDEPTVRTVTARALKAFGFDVIEAEDGLDGVRLFTERRDEIRCILLDMTMPRMNGEDAFVEMKRLDPDCRIILMSGYTEQDATERFSGRGLAGFIQKPYELASLRTMIREALEGPSAL